MKKTAILLVVMLVVSIFALSSCDLIGKIPGIGDLINKPCEEHVDADGDYICDKCEAELEKNDTPPPCEHKDENKDHNCDLCEDKLSDCAAAEGSHNCSVCGNKLSECKAAEGSHNCAICGKAASECADADTDHKCDVCGTDMGEHAAAEGSHNCAYCGKAASECADADTDYKCDVCGKEMLPENMERVNYSLNISDLEAGTLAADSINSKFTIVSGSEIRNRTKSFEGVEYTKSVKIGNSATKIKVSVPGNGTLSFLIQNGSSGAAMQFITVTGPDGKAQDIEFLGTDGGSPVVKIDVQVTEGEWIISRGKNGGTQDIFFLSLSCIVEKSEENGFELVSAGTVDYLCGQQLDLGGLRLNATYANGKTEPLALEDVTVDTSLVNLGQSGVYPLTISYKNYAPISVNINVYHPESVELHFDAVEKLAQNSAAGNGVYYNHSFKEVYFLGDTLDLAGLSVIVKGSLGEENSKEFNIGKDYTVSDVDLSIPGEHILEISYDYVSDKVSATVAIYVVDEAITPDENGVLQALVDPAYLGLPGILSGPFHVFSTIQQALDFLDKVDANVPKVLTIAPGYYNEKIEITVPNLTIVGVGEKPDDVVIEWDSLYGLVDAGGFTHTTDSTQTVAIRESAYNVTIENITISNYWNSQERMNAAGLGIERGLALLVQADRFTMKNSRLLGIQDTLELFTGRQYFENVFISGYTDFIFGTNNTTLFKGCTIHVIDTEKDDKGTAGYLTAFKGSNKGANDAIVYGAIFDGCKFTADEGVMEGKTAIGRTWGAYAAVAVINSEIGGHISLDGYVSSDNKNKRYISMNGIHPTDETVQFVEYNNTGAGAITEAVAGMRFLTAEEAAKYVDFEVIFGKTNGKVTYLTEWNPLSDGSSEPKFETHAYHFDGKETPDAINHKYDQNLQGTTGTFGDLNIDATTGKLTARASDSQFNAGAKISFAVKAGSIVTITSYPNYHGYTVNGTAATEDVTILEFDEDMTVEIVATETAYLYSIIIQSPVEEIKYDTHAYHFDGKETPDAINHKYDQNLQGTTGTFGDLNIDATTGKLTARASDSQFNAGAKISFAVKAGSTVIVTSYPNYHGYTINGTAATEDVTTLELDEDTTVEIIATETAYLYSIIIVAPVVEESKPAPTIVAYHFDGKETPEATNHVYDQNLQGTTGTFGDLNIDATTGKLTARDSDSQFNAGAKISFAVKAGSTVTITSYPGYHNYTVNGVAADADAYTITVEADGTVEIIATETAYLYSIIIVG